MGLFKNTCNKAIHKWNVRKTRLLYKKIDTNRVPAGKSELRLFAIARNESLRLPYFLKFYTENGIDRIFLIDNNSTDDTIDIALTYPNVHVFKINRSFKNFWYWIEYFLDKYGTGRWCMVVDIDELFFYPYAEFVKLKLLVKYLEEKRFEAIRCFLLDMYSDKAIIDTQYSSGNNPVDCCPYFDPQFSTRKAKLFDKKQWRYFESIIYTGGMRNRVFNKISGSNWNYYLSKIPLFKYSEKVYLTEGMHAINGAEIADISGIVFHTKFLSDFIKESESESKREVHFGNALEYKIYNKAFSIDKRLSLKYYDSVKFENSRQLHKIGMMTGSIKYSNYLLKNYTDIKDLFASHFMKKSSHT